MNNFKSVAAMLVMTLFMHTAVSTEATVHSEPGFTDTDVGCIDDCLDTLEDECGDEDCEAARYFDNFYLTIGDKYETVLSIL